MAICPQFSGHASREKDAQKLRELVPSVPVVGSLCSFKERRSSLHIKQLSPHNKSNVSIVAVRHCHCNCVAGALLTSSSPTVAIFLLRSEAGT